MADKRIIFIADDSSDIRESTSGYLEAVLPEFEYQIFNSGQELETRLKQGNLERVALAIIDNNMPPGLDGSEIIAKYAPNVPFRFILRYAGVDSIGEQAVKDGAVLYVKKPDKLSELAATIRGLLEKKD